MNSVRTTFLVALLCLVFQASAQDSRENADFKLAINLYRDGLYDLAGEQLKQFVAAYPTTDQGIEARFYLGLTQLKLGQYDDARLTFQTFALTYQNNPRAPEAWWNVGASYAAVGNHREAALAYERVKVFHPRSKNAADALVEAGKHFLAAGERDNARRVLKIVLQEYAATPAALAARTQLGRLYFEEGNIESAQNELKRVVAGDPSPDARAQALLTLGTIEHAMGRTAQAESRYREIITTYRASPALQGALVGYGRLLAEGGRYKDAADNYRKALGGLPGTTDSTLVLEALVGLGDVSAAGGSFRDAVQYYQRFLAASPENALSHDVLAKLADAAARGKEYRVSGDACTRLLRAAAPDSLQRFAQLRLAINAEQVKNPSLALQLFSVFLERRPDDPHAADVLFHMGEIAERALNDPRKASAWYEQLQVRYDLSPLVDDAVAAAARCQERLREFGRALDLYRDLVRLYPCSELRPEAEERMSDIETFELREKDRGLEKLALLVGDVLGERDRADLAFRLGEIYFHDLKNYEAAAKQFTDAYTTSTDPARTAEALLLRAQSYDFLSRKDPKARRQAIEAYETYLRTAAPGGTDQPRTEREDAVLALFRLTTTTPGEARSAYGALSPLIPGSPRIAEMQMGLARLLMESDSTAAALPMLHAVLRSPAPPDVRHQASFGVVEALLALGETDSALSLGTIVLADAPAHPRAAHLTATLADLRRQRGEYARAATLYRTLSTTYAYTEAARDAPSLLAETLLAQGEAEEAARIYSELVAMSSSDVLHGSETDPPLLLSLAKARAAAGDNPGAKTILFRLLTRERTGPVAGEALTTLGTLYRQEGALDIATAYFRQASSAAPAGPARRDVADLLFMTGDYPDAIQQYTRLARETASNSEHADYRARIILARLRTDDLTQANKEITLYLRTYPDRRNDHAAFELDKGHAAFRQKNYPAALASFTTVAEKFDDTPSAPVAGYWVGKTLEATGKYEEAVEQLTSIISRYPGTPTAARASLALGNIGYTRERWDEAIRAYRRVVDDPDPDPEIHPLALSNLIETYEATGVYDAALSLTRRYLEMYPNADDAFDKRIKVGTLYERLGYYDQAVLHLQGLLEEAGSDLEGEIRYYIAEANYNKGDYQQAILDFLKVPYLVTKKGKIDWTANALYMSGQSYERMGRHEQAITMYQQILDRAGIDETYRAAAKKEIDRVKLVLKDRTN